jgi:hypothetical protein
VSHGVERIVSGGQTGVDRAALDAALELGLACGGWCPRGRLAEDGNIPAHYPLRETPTDDYAERTEWNVRDSDGTLVLTWGPPSGGTGYTITCARQQGKPFSVVDLKSSIDPREAVDWITAHLIKTLNVAGPRASHDRRIYRAALAYLRALLQ